MKEIRCNNCNKKLFEVDGEDYRIEMKCTKCKHEDVYENTHKQIELIKE